MMWNWTAVIAVLSLCLHPAPVVAADDDFVYRVVEGDTLIGLSSRLLNSPADWPKVARYNKLPDPNYILPGAQLRVPLALLKGTAASVTVAHVQGEVKGTTSRDASASVLALGAALGEGASVITGKDGYATLKLPDGSTVRVQSGTEMQVERIRTYPEAGILESAMRVIAGRMESLVQKFRPEEKKQTRHGVKTPLANLAVRGTEFRVTMDTQSGDTRGEVLEGAVAMVAEGGTSSKRLEAGFGAVVEKNRLVSEPIRLLAAPDVTPLPKLQERTILRFPLPAVAGAAGYRAQVARDETFNAVVAEVFSATPDLRVTNVDDGGYFLRVRAVDGRGLEGRDAQHAFTLKARPEPPAVVAPPPKGKLRAAGVEFKWAENTEAATYHLQVARDAAFKALVHEDKAVKGGAAMLAKLPPGDYFWRVASLRASGDRGPYGDAVSFSLFPAPAQPDPPKVSDMTIEFRWAGEPGQTFEFQLAQDAKFAKLLLEEKLSSPEVVLPRPKNAGTYFMRFRARDPDGFVGPYTAAQRFVVPEYPFPYTFPVPSLPLFTPP